MKSQQLREKYVSFFVGKKHKEIPPAPLIPLDDPTTLFNGSGMQQLVPYLKGEAHPMGKRLVDSQPCFRAEDIEQVGDNRHTTFFEMLGNWSLGDYFKKEQLSWFFEFLTQIVGLDPDRLYVSVFEGNKAIPEDKESVKIWQELFDTTKPVQSGKESFDEKIKIYSYEASKNWWSRAGVPENMPTEEIGGPDSEVFYDFGKDFKLHENSSFKDEPCHINCDCGRFFEIGNSVFMEYEKQKDGSFKPLPNKNVDFGGGLERIAAAKINSPDIFRIDLLWPIIELIENFCKKKYKKNEKPMRVIADHMRAAVFMAQEGLEPSNKMQGYAMRRLIRRSVVKMKQLDAVPLKLMPAISQQIVDIYGDLYFSKKNSELFPIIEKEIDRFERTIERGTKLLKTKQISGKLLFDLHQTDGFPFEISQEILEQSGRPITEKEKKEFEDEKKKHQKLSQTASKGMFKSGLADSSEEIICLHTATHLLHEALRMVLGDHVQQVGSHITGERLRFDFTHSDKLKDTEIEKIEVLVKEQIKKNLPVKFKIMNLAEAKKEGALAFFGQKYPDKVRVYFIGPSVSSGQVFSKEVCGGPHVDFTGKIGSFKIVKEGAVGAGKRRIYATIK